MKNLKESLCESVLGIFDTTNLRNKLFRGHIKYEVDWNDYNDDVIFTITPTIKLRLNNNVDIYKVPGLFHHGFNPMDDERLYISIYDSDIENSKLIAALKYAGLENEHVGDDVRFAIRNEKDLKAVINKLKKIQ